MSDAERIAEDLAGLLASREALRTENAALRDLAADIVRQPLATVIAERDALRAVLREYLVAFPAFRATAQRTQDIDRENRARALLGEK
jgi:hypothetical protein